MGTGQQTFLGRDTATITCVNPKWSDSRHTPACGLNARLTAKIDPAATTFKQAADQTHSSSVDRSDRRRGRIVARRPDTGLR